MKTYIREFAHTVIFAITILLVACIFAIPAMHFWVMDVPIILLAIACSFLALFSIFFAIVAIKNAIQQHKTRTRHRGKFPYTNHHAEIEQKGLEAYAKEILAYLQEVEHRWWAYKNTTEKLTEEEQQVVLERFSESMKTFANAREACKLVADTYQRLVYKKNISREIVMFFNQRQ